MRTPRSLSPLALAALALHGCGGLVPVPYKAPASALFDPTPAVPPTTDSGGEDDTDARPPADLECADVWLGSAVGAAVATGTNLGAADDHAYCGEDGGDTGWSYRAGAGEDLLYWWVAPADGAFTFDTNGSSYDTMLTIYQGGCDGAIVACNDDSIYGLSSQVSARFRRGDAVIIALDGFSEGAAGDFVLNISEGGADTGWWTVDTGIIVGAAAHAAPDLRVLAEGDDLRVKVEGAGSYALALARADEPSGAEACGVLREDGVESRCHQIEVEPMQCASGAAHGELRLHGDTSGTPGVGASRYTAADLDQLGLMLIAADGRCFTFGATIPAFDALGCEAR